MSDTDPQQRRKPEYGEYASPEEQRAAIKQPEPWQVKQPATDAEPVVPAPGAYQPGSSPYGYPPQMPPRDPAQGPYVAAPPTRVGPGDRIATFVLLGFGLYNVVDMVVNAVGGGASIRESAEQLGGAESELISQLPNWLWTIGAVAYSIVWLIALFTSLATIRAGKRAFWIPLVAGIVAMLLIGALIVIALGQNPELIQNVPLPTQSPGTSDT